ncbi:lysosomal acid glucosylceramidase-like isoform X2 [Periplaneta americana]|uniref:lysosomal acid glucosylceramidase-like isoform X2 n=1 Tax=Periplaneta americana TaxID=6978 RepID=UPI0037E9659A
MWILILLLHIFLTGTSEADRCVKRKYGYDSFVCVCNATYCDELHPFPTKLLKEGHYLHYVSSREGKRLESTLSEFKEVTRSEETALFRTNTSVRYQKVLGFGGAMSDSAALNIASLSRTAQEKLLRQYFAPEGAEYNIIRIPMGGTDFSRRHYIYANDQENLNLTNFNLTEEDLLYKIPIVKRAIHMSVRNISLCTTSWTSPSWMKEPRNVTGFSTRLRDEFYQLYADYYVRFLDAYEKYGLHFWALSPQNEPTSDLYARFHYNSMSWLPKEEQIFVSQYLGPTLERKGFRDIKIMLNDDQRFNIPEYATKLLSDKQTNHYVSGIAVHFYFDSFPNSPTDILTEFHELFPDKFILYTEACIVANLKPGSANTAVQLGNWDRGENYSFNIIQDMNNWAGGWIDWNLVLNVDGGPNWVGNVVDAAVIVNATADEFYKQPMFYAQAHFSKFVLAGSTRIRLHTEDDKGLEHIAFIRPDDVVVIVLLNRKNWNIDTIITTEGHGDMLLNVPAHSIHTILYDSKTSENSGGSLNRIFVFVLLSTTLTNLFL